MKNQGSYFFFGSPCSQALKHVHVSYRNTYTTPDPNKTYAPSGKIKRVQALYPADSPGAAQ